MRSREGLSFTQFRQLCEQNLQAKYVSECVFCIENEDCLFHPGSEMPRDHVSAIYTIRLRIAMDSDNLHEPDYIPDFKQIVENIESAQSSFVGILWLCCEKFSYLVFYEPDARKILGILKATSKGGLAEKENYNTETINRGMSSGAEKYSKGEFGRDWK